MANDPRSVSHRGLAGAMVLIGQDLLASCRFTYDGRKGRLMMSY